MSKRFSMMLIDFGGFYESIHADEIEHASEQMFQDDQGDDIAPEGFHDEFHFTPKMLESYSKAYVQKLKEYLEEEYDLDLESMTFEQLTSPKFYNFETDRIFVTVDEKDVKKIQQRCLENKDELKSVIKELYEPRSGFIPFYSDDLSDWEPLTTEGAHEMDHNELGTLLKAAADGGWNDMEVIASGDNFRETVDRIVEAHMPPKCKKMLREFDAKQHDTGLSLG